ncbi:MAG: site-specific DNA-methyltransferase [Candidatus Aenigmatarchaeota archaeon]
MRYISEGSIDLIITSPPYANKRGHDYNTVSYDRYVEYFLGFSALFYRLLKDTGSFVLNIKEGVDGIERSTYVYELALALRNRGWLWIDEYIWHKKTTFPGRRKYRLKDAFERIYHFAKSSKFKFNIDNVKVPVKESTLKRVNNLGNRDFVHTYSNTNSKMSRRVANMIGMELVMPSNVLYISPVTKNLGHSAAYPIELVDFFIKLMTDEGDIVLDPFGGSGTTAISAINNGRRCILIEKEKKYFDLAINRVKREVGLLI